MSLKFCPKCGGELEPDSRYCVSCGADLGKRKEVTETTPYVAVPEKKAQVTKISPEGVEYGDFWPRLVALIIDGIIISIISSSLSWIFIQPWTSINTFDVFGGGFWYTTFPFEWLIGFLYSWLLENYNQGQTLGKAALNLRTVDEKTLGQAPSGNYAVNNLLKPSGLLIIDFIIGILKNSSDPKRRFRIMQYVSETVVIRTK